MNSNKILCVTTSHNKLGDTGETTGVWLEELSTPYWIFKDSGYDVEIASIYGGAIPIDPKSMGGLDVLPESATRFLADEEAMNQLENSKPIEIVNADDYCAIFLPGGHGVMWDFPDNEKLAEVVGKMHDNGKVVAAVCHGPAGLLSAVHKDGKPLVHGKKVTSFTNSEESAMGLTKVVPFLLESELLKLDANFQHGLDFHPFSVFDGKLVTGQNPASSELVARHVIKLLRGEELK